MFFKPIINWMGRTFLNIFQWSNYTNIAHMTSQLVRFSNTIFIIHPSRSTANFSEVVTQFHLTENDLIRRAQYFGKLISFWLFVFGVVCLYALYLIIKGVWLGVLSTVILAIMILCQVFRYHFWLFQLKQRRLGCSFDEWFQAFLGKGK